MSYQVELVNVPPLWVQLTGDALEQATARFLSHEHDDSSELRNEKDDSDESPF
ncbi:hypothetical protein H8F21_15345 [Pseudomonas sp. P66]|uniref:Uncharacterized protein n=1 Tax=Pseudomonas arcuscaelestis TaxID=2710591 RepID=A0ABS2BZ80_9PSED|nr:hypothetical protein [Pseudomonas arcuscaelestis]MBM5458941.1 hypothetical protein [Pseudomonas arcuscaelestis]